MTAPNAFRDAEDARARVVELTTNFITRRTTYTEVDFKIASEEGGTITVISAGTGASYGLKIIERRTNSGAYIGTLTQVDGRDITDSEHAVLADREGADGTRQMIHLVGDGTLALMAF